jgi:hypothetical protein
MTNLTRAAGTPAALRNPRWESQIFLIFQPDQRNLERERLEARARDTHATAQLLRCFTNWTRALEQLSTRALERLAADEAVDPNDPDAWRSRDAHAQAILHRHGRGKVSATRLTAAAITAKPGERAVGRSVVDRDLLSPQCQLGQVVAGGAPGGGTDRQAHLEVSASAQPKSGSAEIGRADQRCDPGIAFKDDELPCSRRDSPSFGCLTSNNPTSMRAGNASSSARGT